MATKAAAMPAAVLKNAPAHALMARQLAAVFFDARLELALLFSVCGAGMNSSLDTDWVGIGEGKADVSAGNNCSSSSALRNPIRPSL
jgi:hypothetical protein